MAFRYLYSNTIYFFSSLYTHAYVNFWCPYFLFFFFYFLLCYQLSSFILFLPLILSIASSCFFVSLLSFPLLYHFIQTFILFLLRHFIFLFSSYPFFYHLPSLIHFSLSLPFLHSTFFFSLFKRCVSPLFLFSTFVCFILPFKNFSL